MGVLDKYESYRILFRIDTGVYSTNKKCSSKVRHQKNLKDVVEGIENHGHEVYAVRGITRGSFTSNDTYDIDELREPVL